jgi:probable F420-dependent oxidoreductase
MEGAILEIGRLGVWSFTDAMGNDEAIAFVRRIEELGYGALWIPEAVGFDPFVRAGFLLAHTERLVLATGIANIYARDPMAMKGAQNALAVQSGGRFLLGLGVSHAPFVSDLRGHAYGKPVTTMRAYLEGMESATYAGPPPPEAPPIVIGALREKMLRLSAEKTRGAHPYLTTPGHTERAREILGPDAWLCPEVKVLLETDADKARALSREACKVNISLPNYQRNLAWLGYDEADWKDGGSDRLIDDLVGWGDEAAIRAKVEAHLDAGASHVAVHTISADGFQGVDMRALELLAPA